VKATPCLAPTVSDSGRPCKRPVIKIHDRDRCPAHGGRYVPAMVAEFFGGKSMAELARFHGVTVEHVEEVVREWGRGLQ